MRKSASNTFKMAKDVFDLKRYRPLSGLNELQWFGQIIKRKAIWDALKSDDSKAANERMKDLLSNPLSEYLQFRAQIEESKSERGFGAVKPLTFEDIESLYERANKVSTGCDTTPQQPFEEAALSAGATFGLFLHNSTYLKISLTESNAEILAGVKKWLEYRRGISGDVLPKQQAAKLMSEANALTKAENSILAFLDHRIFHENIDQSNSKTALLELKLFIDDHPDVLGGNESISSLLSARLDDDESSPNFTAFVKELIDGIEKKLEKIAASIITRANTYKHLATLTLGEIPPTIETGSLKNKTRSWIVSGVIPYFDLRAWAKLNNIALTNAEMARLLSKSDPRSLSQTTDCHFKTLFETSFAYQLLSAYLNS